MSNHRPRPGSDEDDDDERRTGINYEPLSTEIHEREYTDWRIDPIYEMPSAPSLPPVPDDEDDEQ